MDSLQALLWLNIGIIILCSVILTISLVSFFFYKTSLIQHNQPLPKENLPKFKKVLQRDGRVSVTRDRMKPVYNDDRALYQKEQSQE